MPKNIRLGVNIDHIATLRQARKGLYPDVIQAAVIAQQAGAHGITMHLREDRRHIQDNDLFAVRKVVKYLNMEMAVVPEIIEIALKVKPDICCFVPEKRRELTTEGGLDVVGNQKNISAAVARLNKKNISSSLFIDPDLDQIKSASLSGAEYIELHTGVYADTKGRAQKHQLKVLEEAVFYAQCLGLKVNAGHGLTYENVPPIAAIQGLIELNIGHNIVARAVYIGMAAAVKSMLKLMQDA
ncbi:MAG: pyridoxine 5'-phosphate synthase [Candidatus Margulisiibacteriota bacterium]|jgi:pyridoxine 5-phosphate synthase